MTVVIAFLFRLTLEWLTHLMRAIETELATRQAIAELSEMNDYTLRDIGIRRGEIEFVVRQPRVPAVTEEDASVHETASIVPRVVATSGRTDARSLPPRAAA